MLKIYIYLKKNMSLELKIKALAETIATQTKNLKVKQ
jgi:hypothetical protein